MEFESLTFQSRGIQKLAPLSKSCTRGIGMESSGRKTCPPHVSSPA